MAISDIDVLLAHAAAPGGASLGGSAHLHCTDADGEWLLLDGVDGALEVRHEHAKGDVAARGPAAALLALLSGGGDGASGDAVEVFGDRAVLDRLVERARPTS